MGARKRNVATARKAALKSVAYAKLNDCPTSPRKMRLVADMIRGKRVDMALAMLRLSTKEAAGRLEKLLLSALSNWQLKNESLKIEEQELVVKSVNVDAGRQLKRLRPAPQGRGHRIRKRSNHITLIVDNKNAFVAAENNTAN
ncbi:MAG: 50S ribosomal protein L22 [Bacteroidetes bacterium]|jgi:large subunit ribosomal protein L22|nr:50S ribosomal protein L22 [Bacteroidota bacterium]MBK9320760.1 50S ribosomal protein L22 [Bacteroidota bacterium]MBK9400966.1 50S ribosomal protein L22 [Bacteroidota bacterium]MBL0097413.1 50S ribosomal protein L22 [Bacteroidota bacterium]